MILRVETKYVFCHLAEFWICTELSILTSSLDDYTYDVMADTTLAPRTQQTQVSKRIAFGAKQMVDQSKQVYQLC